jgi:hypothetical protein
MRLWLFAGVLGLSTLGACASRGTIDSDGGQEDRAADLFDGFDLQRSWGPCPPGMTCQESVTITHWLVRRMTAQNCVTTPSPAEASQFGALATRPDVLAAILDPNACAMVVDLWEQMSVTLRSGDTYINRMTAGCTAGPLTELRNAALALADRYCPTVATDGGGPGD